MNQDEMQAITLLAELREVLREKLATYDSIETVARGQAIQRLISDLENAERRFVSQLQVIRQVDHASGVLTQTVA